MWCHQRLRAARIAAASQICDLPPRPVAEMQPASAEEEGLRLGSAVRCAVTRCGARPVVEEPRRRT